MYPVKVGGDVSLVLLLGRPSPKHGSPYACGTNGVYTDSICCVIQCHRLCERDQSPLRRDIGCMIRLADETDHTCCIQNRTLRSFEVLIKVLRCPKHRL